MSTKEATLIERLDGALPGFHGYCWSEDNLYQERGEITVHGVCLTCVDFLLERHESLPSGVWPLLARIINELVSGTDEELYNAVCTCLLEGIAGEVPDLERFLRGAAKDYWDEWK